MEKKLYTEEEFARVKWYLISAKKEGTQDDVFSVIQRGYLKNRQIRDRLHKEGVIDLVEIQEAEESL